MLCYPQLEFAGYQVRMAQYPNLFRRQFSGVPVAAICRCGTRYAEMTREFSSGGLAQSAQGL